MTCQTCATADELGWWGDSRITHCRGCHATWNTGTRTSHCRACHQTFSTPANFDRHGAGTKDDPGWRCRPGDTVGLVNDPNSYGVEVWHLPGCQERFSVTLSQPRSPAVQYLGADRDETRDETSQEANQ